MRWIFGSMIFLLIELFESAIIVLIVLFSLEFAKPGNLDSPFLVATFLFSLLFLLSFKGLLRYLIFKSPQDFK